MTFGGGTFTEKNKEIPGVYANFQNVTYLDSSITYSTVAFLIPYCSDDGLATTEIKTITKNENYSETLKKFATSEKGGFSLEALKWYCQEIFLNAYNIHLIPMKMKYISPTYTNQETADSIVSLLDGRTFNVLLALDINDAMVSFGVTTTSGSVNYLFKNVLEKLIPNTTSRFQWVVGTDSQSFIDNSITDSTKAEYRKWFVIPYTRAAAPFIAGLLSSLTPGKSAAGVLYNGTVEATYLAPKNTSDQEKALISGRFCFYTLGVGGTTQIRVLKDITAAHYKASTSDPYIEDYNDRMGQIVRVQIYFYKFFETVYPRNIQGKPNNARYRAVIKGILLKHLHELEDNDVLENVSEDHVTVDLVKDQKNAIEITIKYMPVSGIDYVYITFLVN